MSGNTTTWMLVGGLVVAGTAAALYNGASKDAASPGPDPVASAAPAPPLAEAPPTGRPGGKVAEVLQVDNYTYLRFEDGTWAAVSKAPVAVGDEVSLASATLMRDFESKALKRTFPKIYFGSLATGASAAGSLPPGHPPMGGAASPSGHPPMGGAASPHGASGTPAASDVNVPRAEGGVTVAELFAKAAELEGKKVTFAGQVMKVTPRVLGKTWLHIQDGTGDSAAGTHDVVVTTQANPNVGDTVTLTGTLSRNKDLGSGYRYDVLVEDATVAPAAL